MNTSLPSEETNTWLDVSWSEGAIWPSTAPAALPFSASVALMTSAPLPTAARTYLPPGVIVTVFFAPGAWIVAAGAGAREPLWLLRTATASPVETNEYLPSGVTAMPNGLPPTAVVPVLTPASGFGVAARALHGG